MDLLDALRRLFSTIRPGGTDPEANTIRSDKQRQVQDLQRRDFRGPGPRLTVPEMPYQSPQMASPVDEYQGEPPDYPGTFQYEPGDYEAIMRAMMGQPRMWPSPPQSPFDQGPAGERSIDAFRLLRRGGRNQGGGFQSY